MYYRYFLTSLNTDFARLAGSVLAIMRCGKTIKLNIYNMNIKIYMCL